MILIIKKLLTQVKYQISLRTMNVLSMIKGSDPNMGSSNYFWVENTSDWTNDETITIPSPVFISPNETSDHLISHQEILNFSFYKGGFQSNKLHTKNQKNYKSFKNQNHHFRKMGHLKQPGGASCNQRR